MMTVDLTEQEWQAVIQCMAYAPANMSVIYMNKIGAQVQKQQSDHNRDIKKDPGNSRDMPATIPTDNVTAIDPKRSN